MLKSGTDEVDPTQAKTRKRLRPVWVLSDYEEEEDALSVGAELMHQDPKKTEEKRGNGDFSEVCQAEETKEVAGVSANGNSDDLSKTFKYFCAKSNIKLGTTEIINAGQTTLPTICSSFSKNSEIPDIPKEWKTIGSKTSNLEKFFEKDISQGNTKKNVIEILNEAPLYSSNVGVNLEDFIKPDPLEAQVLTRNLNSLINRAKTKSIEAMELMNYQLTEFYKQNSKIQNFATHFTPNMACAFACISKMTKFLEQFEEMESELEDKSQINAQIKQSLENVKIVKKLCLNHLTMINLQLSSLKNS